MNNVLIVEDTKFVANLLKNVANVLQHHCRKTDLVARMGGEEFTIMLVNMPKEDAMPFFEQIRQAVENSETPYKNEMLRVTISIGVNGSLNGSLVEMLDLADQKLYEAKNNGRNLVVLNQSKEGLS